MSKYIDVDIFRTKITDLCANANFHQQKAMEESNREDFVSSGGEIFAYAKVLSFINSLQQEQSETELEEETVLNYVHKHYYYDKDFDGYGHSKFRPVFTRQDLIDFARDFYELGLKVGKE